jgi:adenine deaminase
MDAAVGLGEPRWDKLGLGREPVMDVALGNTPADTVFGNGSILDVHTGRIYRGGIAVRGNRIAAVGDVEYTLGDATELVDATDQILVPGSVVPHFHQWHSNHNGTVVAQCLLERGVTALTDGFYGPGIVAGKRGIRFFLDEMLRTPLKLIFLVPTHAYVQNRGFGFPPAPRSITADDMLEMLEWPESWGLEETGHDVLFDPKRRDPAMVRVLERAHELRKVPTGHGINFPSSRAVNAWVAAGIMTNHEAITPETARRDADAGLYVLLREAPGFHNVHDVARTITEHHYQSRAFQLCPDVAWAESIFDGHHDLAIREAIRSGLDPITVIQMSTIQPAEFLRVNHEVGSLAPGRFADIVLVSDLARYEIDSVYVNGEPYLRHRDVVMDLKHPEYPQWMRETMNLPRAFTEQDFQIRAPCNEGVVPARVIDITDGEYFTDEVILDIPVRDGVLAPSAGSGVNLVALIDRLHGQGEFGVGLVRGFGLSHGAMGSAVNPMTQAIVAVGAHPADIATAVAAVVRQGGAFVAVADGDVVAEFPTPLLGMASDLAYHDARASTSAIVEAWRRLGCTFEIPFGYLEMVGATTEPALRISTQGLVRVSTKGDLTMHRVSVIVDGQ